MRHRWLAVASLLASLACNRAPSADSASRGELAREPALQVTQLRWGGSALALGVLRLRPSLQWQLQASGRGHRQSAYQVLVASRSELLHPGRADIWDSGKVPLSDSLNVRYAGPELQARQRGVWTARVWDELDVPSAFAAPASWEVGPWDEEVEGEWIGVPKAEATPGAVVYLRRSFSVPRGFKEGRLYATAFGVYRATLNGRKVSEDVLTPGLSDYDKRDVLQTYDVGSLLREGENVVGVVLAGGWCSVRLNGIRPRCGEVPPRLRLTLEVTRADGSLQTLESDDRWRYASGPWLAADLIRGERYDARRERPGWDAPGFDESDWPLAVEHDVGIERNVIPDRGAPLRVLSDQRALAVTRVAPDRQVFDLGRRLTGWVRLTVEAAAGSALTLRYARSLRSDGTLDESPSSLSPATDRYVARGAGLESWEPGFSLRDFRYVELQGATRALGPDAVVGRSVGSLAAPTGTLRTSDPRLDALFERIGSEQERAFVSVPYLGADGWSRPGDQLEAQLFAVTSCLNRDVQSFYRKWIDDLRDAQLPNAAFADTAPFGNQDGGALFGAAGVLVPWAQYLCYADREALDPHLTSMGRFLDRVVRENPRLIWENSLGPQPFDPGERGSRTRPALLASAQLIFAARALSQMLAHGGAALSAEADKYARLEEGARAAFNAEFVQPDGRLVSDTQSAYAVAIARGALTGDALRRAGEHLVAALKREDGRLTTGTLGTALLLPALSGVGRDDLAYQLLQGFAREDPVLPPLPLSLGAWMYEVIGGIALDPEQPAGRHLRVRPRPGPQLGSASASFASAYGEVRSAWSRGAKGFRLRISLPVGSSASVELPGTGKVTESGLPLTESPGVRSVVSSALGTSLELEAGAYDLLVSP